MRDLKCKGCGKLLAKVDYGEFEIKCGRCNKLNLIKIYSQKVWNVDIKSALSDNISNKSIKETTESAKLHP